MLASFRVLSRLRRCPSGPRSRTDCGLMLFCFAQASTSRLIFVFPFARISTTPCCTRSVSVNWGGGGLYHHFDSERTEPSWGANLTEITASSPSSPGVAFTILDFLSSPSIYLDVVCALCSCVGRQPIFSSYSRNKHLSAVDRSHNGRSCGGELPAQHGLECARVFFQICRHRHHPHPVITGWGCFVKVEVRFVVLAHAVSLWPAAVLAWLAR